MACRHQLLRSQLYLVRAWELEVSIVDESELERDWKIDSTLRSRSANSLDKSILATVNMYEPDGPDPYNKSGQTPGPQTHPDPGRPSSLRVSEAKIQAWEHICSACPQLRAERLLRLSHTSRKEALHSLSRRSYFIWANETARRSRASWKGCAAMRKLAPYHGRVGRKEVREGRPTV
jgi:hypothetical protein